MADDLDRLALLALAAGARQVLRAEPRRAGRRDAATPGAGPGGSAQLRSHGPRARFPVRPRIWQARRARARAHEGPNRHAGRKRAGDPRLAQGRPRAVPARDGRSPGTARAGAVRHDRAGHRRRRPEEDGAELRAAQGRALVSPPDGSEGAGSGAEARPPGGRRPAQAAGQGGPPGSLGPAQPPAPQPAEGRAEPRLAPDDPRQPQALRPRAEAADPPVAVVLLAGRAPSFPGTSSWPSIAAAR